LQHSAEGLSEITYNRCIGTRYCANNCPYKVRRFNYLNWHNGGVWKATGGLPETLQMQQNPNGTVRSRGVRRVLPTACSEFRQQDSCAEGRRDGDVVTACQQTCPADAIVFGDLNDTKSRVSKLTMSDRRYALLEELGTKPRTTYLAKVRNPNPEMT
jgi:molybdopterin-containing oxidoreductase family iron-sulfur binding subunit